MNVKNLDSTAGRWFALRVKSRCEKLVALMAQNRGYEEFLPLYRFRRRWSDRWNETEFPLFPGYVFCRLDLQHRLPLLTIPGVLHFVGIGKTPVPLEDEEIAAIQAAVNPASRLNHGPFWNPDSEYTLRLGP